MDYFQGGKKIMVTEKSISQISDLWKEEKKAVREEINICDVFPYR